MQTNVANQAAPGFKLVSAGFTTLLDGSVKAWIESLPDEAAKSDLSKFAAQAAAGICSEIFYNGTLYDLACRDDLQQLVHIAGALGIGESTDDASVRAFVDAALAVASDRLVTQDSGVAWDRVTTALFRKKSLSAEEVQHIVALL